MPWKRGHSPVTLAPEYEDYLFEQWEHGVFDDYWKQLGIYAEGFYDQFVDVPMITCRRGTTRTRAPRPTTTSALVEAQAQVRCG